MASRHSTSNGRASTSRPPATRRSFRAAFSSTQPDSLRLPVTLDGQPIGEPEDDEWLETAAAVDTELVKARAAGLFRLRHEERYIVLHEFGSGDECLDVAAG